MKPEQAENVAKLVEMVKEVRTCMLITTSRNKENISGRPMSVSKIEDNGTMWFFSKGDSEKIEEVEANPKVAIAITNESHNNYLMINGTANISHDKAKMKELWNPALKAWFPDGIDDPEMILLKITPSEVSYWDSSSSRFVILFNMVKALVTGKEYDEGEHGTITL